MVLDPELRAAGGNGSGIARQDGLAVLKAVGQRVLWLSTAIIDHANRVRPNPSGLKVGGHQASSASMSSIMTALWFHALTADDRVSVKPHASPVLHAINYLLGELDESRLTTLRAFGGLQSYPSRSKDPDPVDYSTGSVGIGATAPLWGALARRYVEGRFGGAGRGHPAHLHGRSVPDQHQQADRARKTREGLHGRRRPRPRRTHHRDGEGPHATAGCRERLLARRFPAQRLAGRGARRAAEDRRIAGRRICRSRSAHVDEVMWTRSRGGRWKSSNAACPMRSGRPQPVSRPGRTRTWRSRPAP